MLKIYPSPFNKFAVFILYGLLSVAVITLAQTPSLPVPVSQPQGQPQPQPQPQIDAQDGCKPTDISTSKLQTIGYVQLYAGHEYVNVNSIPWKLYSYINVIAFPALEQGNQNNLDSNSPWNGLKLPNLNSGIGKDMDSKIKGLVDARNTNNPSAKILLSIRNYDPSSWLDGDNRLVLDVSKAVDTYKLDGADIEYPGMRGMECGIYSQSKQNNDANFVKLINDLRTNITMQGKTIMVTVGNESIEDSNSLNNLTSNINILNIETYHYSLYENIRNGVVSRQTYANNPLNIFDDAFQRWSRVGNSVQRFMGVDFGNTFQVVNNGTITQVQSVGIDEIGYPVPEQPPNTTPEFNVSEINEICPDGIILYSFPWKQYPGILNSDNYCNSVTNGAPKTNWTRKYDSTTSTPWIYKIVDQGFAPQRYLYVSYEDTISLSRKVNYAMGKSITGVSISDVTYDDDNSTLLKYILNGQDPGAPGAPGTGTSPVSSTSNTGSPTNSDSPDPPGPGNLSSGVIAGAVVGSILGLVFISGIAFLGFRYKDRLPFGQNKYNKETMYNYPGTHMNQPGMIPEGSPRMIIPDTTAITVAPSYVTAMFDFAGKEENDLSFKKGDKIEVLERGDGPNDWWVGKVNGAVGEFPGNYVKE